MSSSAPIGILDSGMGGLSVLREIRRELPDESLLYVGDSAFCPYGGKTTEVIIKRVRHISDWLIARGAKLIVIACNSATIAAVETLRAEVLIPIVGMEPGLKPACALSKSRVVGVLATETSLAGEKFHRLLNHHATDDIKVITRPCPRFVELVEAGMLTGPEVQVAVENAILPLLQAGADTLVLGCTHYPFLAPVIREVAGPEMQLIDTGAAVARRVRQQLEHYQLLTTRPEENCQLFSTDQNGSMEPAHGWSPYL
ncbi:MULTISPECIES: glutamate racemase [unclassified Lentimonas]|uniref:glutamate racemase n=1 Tax=unclassified Lentimonas TaxID=2630993 RepID=UPI0013251A35|nr:MULTISPECIES: glutamate racemase [unclassified Lentimonas]CAA6691873.1 Glutamate racemase (EC [Lentimonas sp. CC19]CAA6694616.1 Glutamate racemase (EC [Lentimonas sp. CC10]CAA7072136.1 Glutamate racemase (EC [Lentimonas sp. CC11]